MQELHSKAGILRIIDFFVKGDNFVYLSNLVTNQEDNTITITITKKSIKKY